MTEEQVRDRVLMWQGRLSHTGVGHFEVGVQLTPTLPSDKDSARACVDISPYYDWVEFYITPSTTEAPDLDYVIVHEWLHVAARDLDDATHGVAETLGTEARRLYLDRLDHESEGFIDRLARAIVHAYSV